jgi:glycosyltransferase involved in cell wall biosynthesis
MRILASTHSLAMNGAALYLVEFLTHLKQSGAQVTVAYEGEQALAARLRDEGIDIRSDVAPEDFDVALINTVFDAQKVSLLAPHLPVVFWIHEGLTSMNNTADIPLWRRALQESTRIVLQTNWQVNTVYRSFLQHTEAHRVCVAPLGIERFNSQGRPARDTQPHVLFAGGIFPNKRPVDLAAAVLRLTDLPMKCTMAGSLEWLSLNGPEFTHMLNLRPDLIRLEGEVTDREKMQDLFARANLFCLPSSDECFPRAILEAASAGLPLALTDLPCHAGIWEHGVNALMSPAGAHDLLHWNLRALAHDSALATRLSTAALAVANRFGKERFLRAMVSVLEDAVRDPLFTTARKPA